MMQKPLRILIDKYAVRRYYPVLVAGTKSKKCDKQLNFSTYDKSIVPGTIQIVFVNYCS